MVTSAVEVVCVGVVTLDQIALVPRFPSADERVVAERMESALGGPAAVAAVTLSRLGVETALIAGVGDDAAGREILEVLNDEGVQTQGVVVVPSEETARSMVTVSKDSDSRSIVTRPFDKIAEVMRLVDESLAQSASWVHLDHVGWQMRSALGVERGKGPKISLDLGYWDSSLKVSEVDLYSPTSAVVEAQRAGTSVVSAVKQLAHENQNVVVATLGSRGALGSDGTSVVDVPSFTGEIVSTLGAGDVFHGALVAQFLQGRDLRDSITRASAVASLSCRALDGRTGVPTSDELEEFMAERLARSGQAT